MAILEDVLAELARAEQQFPAMRSAHEGLAITREEYLEFEHEVFWGTPERQREECVQLAAMALRFLKDISDQPRPNEPLRSKFT